MLPPVYVLCVPIFRFSLIQLRVRRTPLHKRVFSAATVGLSYGAASVAFHLLTGTGLNAVSHPLPHPSLWMLAVAAAAIVQWVTNTAMIMVAVKGSDPAVRIRDLLLARENVHNDIAEQCVAVLCTFGIAISPLTIVFALPFVTLLQRSVRHAQLVDASRLDAKTGLLNAGTWEREAASEVARAVRTRTPLALVLIDIDHFKLVNDLHGHLAGDKALRAIAHTFRYSCAATIWPAGSAAKSSRCCCRRPAPPTPARSRSGCGSTLRLCRSAWLMTPPPSHYRLLSPSGWPH